MDPDTHKLDPLDRAYLNETWVLDLEEVVLGHGVRRFVFVDRVAVDFALRKEVADTCLVAGIAGWDVLHNDHQDWAVHNLGEEEDRDGTVGHRRHRAALALEPVLLRCDRKQLALERMLVLALKRV